MTASHRLLFAASVFGFLLGCPSETPSHKPSEAECKSIAANFAKVGGVPLEEQFARDCQTAPEETWKALHCLGKAKSRDDLEACESLAAK